MNPAAPVVTEKHREVAEQIVEAQRLAASELDQASPMTANISTAVVAATVVLAQAFPDWMPIESAEKSLEDVLLCNNRATFAPVIGFFGRHSKLWVNSETEVPLELQPTHFKPLGPLPGREA